MIGATQTRRRLAGAWCVGLLCARAGFGASPADPYELAKTAFDTGAYAVAAQRFEQVLAAEPDHPRRERIAFLLGRSYYERQQWTNSLAAFGRARLQRATPYRAAEIKYWVGRTHEAMQDAPKALFYYEAVAGSEAPAIFRYAAALAAARLYFLRNDTIRARDSASNAVLCADASNPEAEPLFWIGQCDLAEGDAYAAREVYLDALKSESNAAVYPFLQAGLALAEAALGMSNSAVVTFEQIGTNAAPRLQALAAFYRAQRAFAATNAAAACALLRQTLAWRACTNYRGREFALYLRADAPYAEAYCQLGDTWLARADAGQARHDYAACVAEYPAAPVADRARLGLAACLVALGDAPGATQHLQALTCSPQPEVPARSWLLLGDIACQASNHLAAVACYSSALVCGSNASLHAEARLRRAMNQYALGNYEADRADCEALLADDAALFLREDALLWRAWTAARLEPPADARQLFLRYLREFPHGRAAGAVQMQLGRIAAHLGEYAEAEGFLTALATNAVDAERAGRAVYELGWLYRQQGRQNEAVAAFARFAAEHPDSAMNDDVQYYLGETHFNAGDYARAQAAFVRVVEKHPGSPFAGMAAYWSAMAAFRQNAYTGCFLMITSAWHSITSTPLRAAAYLLKGDCLRMLNDIPGATRAYAQAAAEESNSYAAVEALFQLAACATAVSNWNAAAAAYTRLTVDAAAPNRARAWLLLGEARQRAGDERGAMSAWLHVVYEYADQPALFDAAVAHASRVYERLNEPEKAAQLQRLRAKRVPAGTRSAP